MATIRRWYILSVCAVSLQVVVWALIAFLRNMLVPSLGDDIALIARQLAVIIIGVPIFGVHWLWAQRLARQDVAERESFLRRAYLYGMMGLFLLTAVFQLFNLVISITRDLFGVANYHIWEPYQSLGEAITYHLIAVVVLAAGWLGHRSLSRQTKAGAVQALMERLYVYLFTTIGLVITAVSSLLLLQWLLLQISGPDWWDRNNLTVPAETIPGLIVWLPFWLLFWRQAQRLFQQGGEAEKGSLLRKFYLYAVLFVSVLTVVSNAAFILAGLFRRALGLRPEGYIQDVLAGIALGVVGWVYHAYVLHRDETAVVEQSQQANIRRIYWYLMAGIGLLAFLIGLGGEISLVIRALSGQSFDNELREQLARFTAALIAGLPVWLIPWRLIQQAVAMPAAQGDAERQSIVRRFYLYLYLFLATMTVLATAVYIISQLLELLLRSRSADNLFADMGQALAFMGIAVGVWVYHGRLLRRDNRQIDHDELKRLLALKIVVAGSEDWATFLYSGIRQHYPEMNIQRITDLGETGTFTLADADVIVGNWLAMGDEGVFNHPARKLLIPTSSEGVDWLGVHLMNGETAVKQTLHALNRIAANKPI